MKWQHVIHSDGQFYRLDSPGSLILFIDKPGGVNSWYYRFVNNSRRSPLYIKQDILKLKSEDIESAKKEALELFNKELNSLKDQVQSMIEWNNSLEQNTIKDS